MKLYNRIRLIILLSCVASMLIIACINNAYADDIEVVQEVAGPCTVDMNYMINMNTYEIDQVDQASSIVQPEYIEFIATAYCSCSKCCGVWANNRPNGIVYGSTGRELIEQYSIAVDPNVIPYGSYVETDTGMKYRADDCGGAIKGNHIDIYFVDHEKALEWGKQTIKLRIIEG